MQHPQSSFIDALNHLHEPLVLAQLPSINPKYPLKDRRKMMTRTDSIITSLAILLFPFVEPLLKRFAQRLLVGRGRGIANDLSLYLRKVWLADVVR
jgi:hypothetical protein